VCAQISFTIRKKIGITLDKEYWFEHAPTSVETNYEGKVTRTWNLQVKMDKTIPNNKPDITIHNNEK
jgi:hypothetical protein